MRRAQLPLTALAGLILLPATSFAAQNVSYSYFELDYIMQDVDVYEDDEAFDQILEDVDDGDGFRLEASYAFPNNMFIFGNYSKADAEFTFINDTGMRVPEGEDVKTINLGVGYFMPINYSTDFVMRAAYQDVDYGDFAFGQNQSDVDEFDDVDNALADLEDDNSDGFSVDVGVRAQLVDWLEAGGGLRYTDLDSGDDFSFFGNFLFEVNQSLGVNLAVDLGDNATVYKLGARFSL